MTHLFLLVIFAFNYVEVHTSLGDSFPSYRNCVLECTDKRCEKDGTRYKRNCCGAIFDVFKWKCSENCKYDCMWPMVEGLVERDWPVPQFHGKWPFKRILGLQEPASVAFSILNLLTNLFMFNRFREQIRFTLPSFNIWSLYTLVSANCWIWSAVFHGRDTMFTEIMDYISAYAMVLFAFYTIGHRILLFSKPIIKSTFTLICSFAFIYHSLYLLTTEYDYKYNMTTNLLVGTVTGTAMLIWAVWNRKKMGHGKYLIFYVIGMTLASLLELADFPPILWTFDAHSLWHLATAPNAYFMYKFAIEDCKHQRRMFLK
ncbi:post-GPI attachment to proteins factor 3 [Daktulosphaira vitifoliae]|uniref:post-GPI attachment to proteins factor 3 n=1 Tax=Daktulosphaira vitifoliae TaxID=58002 RepID=UPI0021AA0658|nr:post-GPI attachment to proteins factor 3 [Daktulosphaira vitifoliae]